MSNFTPGPWRVDPQNAGDVQTKDGRFEVATAYCPGGDMPEFDECYANMRLIAAAPEMLAALTLLLRSHDATCPGETCQLSGIDLARAAISKATGDTP